ncbi:uncharacterized protein BO80DRAFT_485991 [Aspergillus ibericus CBS 121593]|uniref:F-box domain-containing protein n=1 Tax=Aspergillus ibericus CBS 121593 TaxID=1448316 RepID=A0A395GNS2_9EURO|nr:hypothetical protein BO80DRAFT_485991 [Aspergillus ibericus CBS 121593]RAK95663.1 hypothetical protein BO80DRAFT_485991 [Aspergillus ibericus CBS 121593]
MNSIYRGIDFPPAVVVDVIVDHLDLQSIKALRLTNRAWSKLCLGPRFKSFIRHQTTNLTAESLKSLMELACHPDLGSVVKQLTILADVYDPSLLKRVLHTRRCEDRTRMPRLTARDCTQDELEQARAGLQWLEEKSLTCLLVDEDVIGKILATILDHFGQLDLIALEATMTTAPRGDIFKSLGEWHIIWVQATQVYHIAMTALAQSRIEVEALSVYRETIRCGVPSNEITDFMNNLDAKGWAFSSGQSIKYFALDLSMRVDSNPERLAEERDQLERYERENRRRWTGNLGALQADLHPEAVAEDNFPGVARLLQKMPNLESLVLSLRRTVKGDVNPYHQLFDAIAEIHLPLLGTLSLLGIYATSDSLLRFLQHHPTIRELSLEKIDLSSGSWEPVLQHIQQMPSLTRVILSRIAVAGETVNLRPADDTEKRDSLCHPDYFCCIRGVFVHRREFDAASIREGFQFCQRDQGPPEMTYAFTDFLVYDHEVYGLP